MIKRADLDDTPGICKLFLDNYETYHYTEFSDTDQLRLALESSLWGWISIEDNIIVGFAGMYLYKYKDFTCIELAHLLVDKNYRGLKFGAALEKARADVYMNIPNSVVFVSCVDDPFHSLTMKQQLGFVYLGKRSKYRPSQRTVGQDSIVMGKYNITFVAPVIYGRLSEITIDLMMEIARNCNMEIKFKYIEKSTMILKEIDTPIRRSDILINENPAQSRIIVEINNVDSENELHNTINKVVQSEFKYKACIVNVLNNQFSAIDEKLIGYGFRPVVFMPLFKPDFYKLEYQFI